MPHALSMATALEEHLESEATVASQTASAAVLWPPPELGWESAGVKLLSQTRPIAGCTISGSGKVTTPVPLAPALLEFT